MSQAKVERYKKEKANRKKTLARQKITKRIGQAVACVAAVAIVGCVVYFGVKSYEAGKPAEKYHVNLTALQDYLGGLAE